MKTRISLVLTAFAFSAMAQLPSGNYNVIFIAIDDLKPKLGAYGDPDIQTPNLDSFANSAVTFSNMHCQQAVCGPSRTSMMLGLRPDTTDVWSNTDAADFRNAITNGANLVTLPQHFGDNGYNCHGFSKLFHGNTRASNDETISWNDGWTRASAPYLYYESGKWELFDAGNDTPSLTDKGEFNFRESPAVAVTDESYRDGLTASNAITQLNTYATDYVNTGQKFFLGVGFNKPHLPFTAPKAYWDLYDPADIDLSGYDGTVDLPLNGMAFTGPDDVELSDYADYSGSILEPQARELIHAYMACVSYVDAQIGRILDALDAADPSVRDNTVIVVWSDHGWHLADHGNFWGKTTVFEQSTRSACMISAPGLDAVGSLGTTCSAPVELIDLYPTLVDLCGLPQPVLPNSWSLEGDSLSRLLQNPNRNWKAGAFSQYHKNIRGTTNTGWGMGYSLRTERYRYTEWYITDQVDRDSKAFATPEFVELYDYDTDPDEGNNIAGTETALVAQCASLLDGGNGWSTLNIPPNADAGGPYSGFPNAPFTLDASGSNAGDAAITTYEWDLNNDGSYDDATGLTVTHSFAALGDYSIGLRVTDASGAIATATTTVTVALYAPPQMSASDSDYINKTMIRWHAVRGASLYRVFRNTVDDSGTASDLGTTDSPMFLDTTGTAGTTYFYWVRAESGAATGPLTASDQGTRAVGTQAGPIAPLEPPADPVGNATTAAKVALGKALFWDEQLSSTRTVSCATCHQPEKGGLDPLAILGAAEATHPGPDGVFGTGDDVTGSPGVPGSLASGLYDWKEHFGITTQVTGRYPRPAIDAAYSDELFWDGRADDTFVDPVSGSTILASGAALETQASGPPVGDSEMAHNNRLWTEIVTRIDGATPLALATNIPSALNTWIDGDNYNSLFEEVYGDSTVTAPRIIMAIAAYERTLFSDRTNFDRVNAGIDTITGAQNRGRGVFNRSDCRQCHSGNLGSDDLFHNVGIRPVNTDEDAGRFGVTGVEDDRGRFKTSHLRNVGLRGAFFHTGSVGSLGDVIDFYDRGGDFAAANKDPRVIPRNLTAQEKSDLMEFLNMWTDPRVENASDHFDHPTLYGGSARAPELYNSGIAGTGSVTPQVIAIEPPLGGNPNFTTGIYDGLAGAAATLIVDVDEPGDSIPDADAVLHRADITLVASGDATGTGSAFLAIPDNPGAQLYGRWYVSDPNGSNGIAATQPFRMTIFGTSPAAAAPTADTGGPYTAAVNANVTLDASSSSSGGTIVAWEWDLDNDGNYDDAVGETVQTSFVTAGSQTIGLKITDSNAAVRSSTTTVTVNAVSAPEIVVEQPASISLSDGVSSVDCGSANPGVAAAALTFTVRNTGDAALTGLAASISGANSADFVAGTLGSTSLDPNESTTFTVTFTPSGGGPRSADLDIASNDADENPFDIGLTGTGLVVAPSANAGGPYSADEGASFTLDASGSVQGDAAISSYAWDLDGDGQYDDATGVSPSVSITDSDITSISVLVTSADSATDTATATVNISNVAPSAAAGGPYTVTVNASIQLDGSGSSDPGNDISSYAWDLDADGQYDDATGAQPTHSFTSVGSLTIRLRVTDADGASHSSTASVTVEAAQTTYAIADTAQVTCYSATAAITCPAEGAAFYGQDASYDGNLPSYTTSADGLTVRDNVTGLTWNQTPDLNGDGTIDASDKISYADLATYAASLNAASFGGFSDWRPPSMKELYSLMDFRGTDPSGYAGTDTSGLVPYLDPNYFDFGWGDTGAGERLIDAQFATSTLYVGTVMNGTQAMFGLNLADGRIKGYPVTGKNYYVLFCRGNTDYGVNDFVDNGDGTVTDNATGLMWMQADSGSGMNWQDALAWAEGLSTGGHSDWRLPNAKELQSIVDYTRSPDTTSSAAIDPIFSVTQITNEGGAADYPWYWSGSTHGNYQGGGQWGAYVCFGRAMGFFNNVWQDVHGAGCQRSDPKFDNGTDYSGGHGPQGDAVRILNYVRAVRDAGTVVANNPPTADAAGPYSGDAGDAIAVTGAASTDSDGTIATYAWDLDNDGQYDDATGVTTTYSNAIAGTYTIGLQVTDNDGATDTDTATVTVNPVSDPEIVVEQAATGLTDGVSSIAFGSSDLGVGVPLTFTIRNTGDAALTGLAASFSGANSADFAAGALGSTSLDPNESTTFTVTFTPSGGGTRSADLDIASNDADENPFDIALTGTGILTGPSAEAAGPYAVNEGSNVTLNGSSSTAGDGAITAYAWDADNNGSYETAGVSPGVNFPSSGSFTVGLRVTDANGLTDTDSATVNVANVAPSADAGGPYTFTINVAGALDGSGSSDPGNDIDSYEWDLDSDGQYDDATGATPNATFTSLGSVTIGLRVTDLDGAISTDTATVDVTAPSGSAPIADAGGPYTAQPGENVTLDASGSTDVDGDIASYTWDLDGDGSFGDATGVNPLVTSATESANVITVRVIDAQGNEGEAQTVLTFKQDDIIDWTNLANMNATANVLTKSGGGSAWNANAWSTRALEEPGYIQVSATLGGRRMIGLSLADGGAAINTIEYALYLNISALELYESGTHRGTIGSFAEGDDLRITIDGRDIVYSQNGTELRRVIQAVPSGAYAYHADVSIETNGASLEGIRMVIPAPEGPIVDSFYASDPDNLNLFYSKDDAFTIVFHQNTDQAGLSGTQSKAEVDALFSFSTPIGKDYAGAWADAATYVISVHDPVDDGPEIGVATCAVKPTANIFNAKAPLPADTGDSPALSGSYGSISVLWTEPVNVLIEGSKVTRLFATNESWDSGCVSSREVSTDAYFETTVTQLGKNRMIGFGKDNDDATHTDIDYAFFMHFSGALEVYQDGRQTGGLGRYAVGDVLRMEIDGLEMKYYKNGTLLRTDPITADEFPFKVDVSMQNPLATIDNTILVIPDPAAPYITSCVANDPDNGDTVFSAGDTFTISFSGPTNAPSGNVADIISFPAGIGTLSGAWTDTRTYVVTVDSAGAAPSIGSDSVSPAGVTKIYYENTRVQAAITAATISGHFGRVRNAIRIAYANGLTYDLGQSYAISEVSLTYSGADSAISIETSTDGTSYTTANSATLSDGTSIHDVFANARYLRITGITSLDDIAIYTQNALPATTWDHVDLQATITDGSITASFQAGKPYAILGLLSEDPANLAAPTGNPVVVQSATASSVSTTYFYSDGSTETITWDFDNGDLRCTTNAETQLPGLDLTNRTLVTVDPDGRGVTSGTRSNHLPVALIEGASEGWVIDGSADGSPAFSYASPLTTNASELRIRSYTGDWRNAVTPFSLPAVTSPVRAYSTATNDALVPSQTLLGPLADSAEISAAAAQGYVVVADLASISEADALAAGASVFYPSPTSMSNTLTSGAPFALFDNPGHPLGGHLYKGAIIVAPTGSMYAPTELTSIDEFMAFGCYLPPFGVDSWNEIVAAAQTNDLSTLSYESTATTRSMVYNATNYGTRHTGISTYSGAGALADWKFYNGSTHIGLNPASTYYFNPSLSLDGAASHIQAIPADFALASQSNDGFTKLVLSGNGNLDFVVASGDSAFIDANSAATGTHAIAGSITVRLVTNSDTLIHGSVTSDTLIGRFPSAGGINLVGDGSGTVHVNGVLHSVSGAFNIDLSAYSNSNVLIEFSGSFTSRTFLLTAAPPVADIGGPYSTDEGSGVTLDASNSFNAVTYLWDSDNDGSYDDGTGSTFVFSTAVDGVYTVGLRIENGGQFDTASITVTVNNVAPTANIGGPYISAPGVTATLDASGSSDPGNDIATVEWDTDGDGNFDNGTGLTLAYTPIATGSHTISVRVTDDDGAVSTDSTTFFASNDVEFTAIVNLNVSGNDLNRTSGNGWTASAISVGTLEEDGYMEFTATLAGKAMVGLSENDTASHFSGIKYAIYKNINRIELYEYGVQKGSYGTFAEGDKLRITIDKGDVIYTHNGAELRRVIANEPLEGFSFNADVAMEAAGSAVQDVVLAIPAPENPQITDYEGFDPDNLDTTYGAGDTVSITFHQKTDMGGYAQDQQLSKAQVDELFSFNPAPGNDYTGYWSHPAIFVVQIVDPAATAPGFGSATVQVAGTQPIYNSKVPLLATNDQGVLSGHWGSIVVLWINPDKVIVDGNEILRPASEGEGWDAGARSSRSFTGDGYLESVVTATGLNRMIGFSSADANYHFSDLDFAIFLHASGTAEAYESGVQRGNLGRYAAGDTIRLERDGTDMIYYVNGLPRRSTTVDPALSLQVDCSLYARNASFNSTTLVLPDSVITASRLGEDEPIRDAVSISLEEGWNLIGIPLALDDPNPDFLGQTAQAGHAYWVFAPRPATHILTGVQVAQPSIPANGLYAPVRISPVPVGYTAFTSSDGVWRQLPADAELQPGTGYQLQ